MSIEKTDPRLTAYICGELADADRAEIEHALAADTQLAAFVASLKTTGGTLAAELQREARDMSLSAAQRAKIFRPADRQRENLWQKFNAWLSSPSMVLSGAAATCLLLAIVTLSVFFTPPFKGLSTPTKTKAYKVSVSASEETSVLTMSENAMSEPAEKPIASNMPYTCNTDAHLLPSLPAADNQAEIAKTELINKIWAKSLLMPAYQIRVKTTASPSIYTYHRNNNEEILGAASQPSSSAEQLKPVPTKMEQRLKKIIIPETSFKDADLVTVLSFLHTASGVEFVLKIGGDPQRRVTVSDLKNATLYQWLKLLEQQTGCRAVPTEEAVIFEQKNNR